MTVTDGIQRRAPDGSASVVSPEATKPGTGPAAWHVLDRRIAYLARACGLLRGTFALTAPETADPPDTSPEALNHWPARFLTAVAQEDDAAFVQRYAALFASEPPAEAPHVGLFDRLAEVPSLAAYDGILGRWLDAEDVIHIGDLMAVRRQQGGSPLLLTMADVHPALAVSRWCLVTDVQHRERFEPWLRLLRTLGTEDFDPLAMQCRVLELRERLREVQLEAERNLQAELQKKDREVAAVWHAKDEEIARLGAQLHNVQMQAQTQAAQLAARLAELEAAVQAREGELVQAHQRLSETQSALQSCQEELHRTQQQAAQFQHQLHAILASRSWRLTAPLRRWFGRGMP
ncbi:hypothetical protein [Chloracidobacterium aggregatum]|uniref:Chromosome partition protein Smc n=1 Tax=Chloracidobacterium sp. N TaxID=2821540 RepID=A0ABX8B3L2_9BACT|nr:hypothetical protein [Chloracidobacterium aggregatum]QUV86140.1 hypothetical protein J8C03_15270 [Chloracidobacterium sp. 2]QUV89414.1 hypothetical protein J8C07_12030 [Chloracidobacterium sp. S]QUV92583.1 hypothetical protein J8C04_12575 [Chloracidobacterium sp. A]QUV95058.1 hypothetical protein J8C05_13600 [Chloracidobacterium sp. N]QUV98265.1 hypothetical protein J8C00_14840 [Chloracidobacterium sp. E]